MTKSELIAECALKTETSKIESEKIIDTVLDVIVEQVSVGNKVQLVGFGTFSKSHREARKGKNPHDGSEIKIAATDVPHFKAGKTFKESVK